MEISLNFEIVSPVTVNLIVCDTQAWDNYDFSDAIIIKAIVYLFVWSCTSHTRIFHSYGDVTITSEWIKTLTNIGGYWYFTERNETERNGTSYEVPDRERIFKQIKLRNILIR